MFDCNRYTSSRRSTCTCTYNVCECIEQTELTKPLLQKQNWLPVFDQYSVLTSYIHLLRTPIALVNYLVKRLQKLFTFFLQRKENDFKKQ